MSHSAPSTSLSTKLSTDLSCCLGSKTSGWGFFKIWSEKFDHHTPEHLSWWHLWSSSFHLASSMGEQLSSCWKNLLTSIFNKKFLFITFLMKIDSSPSAAGFQWWLMVGRLQGTSSLDWELRARHLLQWESPRISSPVKNVAFLINPRFWIKNYVIKSEVFFGANTKKPLLFSLGNACLCCSANWAASSAPLQGAQPRGLLSLSGRGVRWQLILLYLTPAALTELIHTWSFLLLL